VFDNSVNNFYGQLERTKLRWKGLTGSREAWPARRLSEGGTRRRETLASRSWADARIR